MIDSHCHLTYAPLHDQLDAVLQRAAAAGVDAIVTVGTSVADTRLAIQLATRHPCVFPTAGVHPQESSKAASGWDAELEHLARRGDTVAVGETGLDYHYDLSDRASQRRVFERECEIATAVGKPLIIHCREAHADTLAVLSKFDRLAGVVFHCFTGTRKEAAEILERGYSISLTGVVTFRKSDELREVARMIPDDRLMVETDAPYLSPEPVRGIKPNEPAFVVHTARCVARQRGWTDAALEALTVANTRRFFRLPAAAGGAPASGAARGHKQAPLPG